MNSYVVIMRRPHTTNKNWPRAPCFCWECEVSREFFIYYLFLSLFFPLALSIPRCVFVLKELIHYRPICPFLWFLQKDLCYFRVRFIGRYFSYWLWERLYQSRLKSGNLFLEKFLPPFGIDGYRRWFICTTVRHVVHCPFNLSDAIFCKLSKKIKLN